MGAVDTTYTFTATDTITSAKMNNIIDQTTMTSQACLSGGGLEVASGQLTIAANAINSSRLAANAVTNTAISNGSVTPAKLSSGGPNWTGTGAGGVFSVPQTGLEFGTGNTQDFGCFIDLHSAATPTDFETRIVRDGGANGDFKIWNQGTGSITLGSASAERLRIASSGNVGIGTSSPGAKLEIQGGLVDDSTPELKVSGSAGNISTYVSLDASLYNPIVLDQDKAIIFTEGTVGTGNLVIAPHSASTSGIRITSSGNVGIKKSSPSTALDVSGTVTATAFAGPLTGNVTGDLTGNASSATTASTVSNGSITAAKLDGAQSGLAPIYGVRAWVNFDASRDASGASNASNTNRFIRSSGNVTSVLKTAGGKFTVTFTSAMPNTNYIVTSSAGNSGSPRFACADRTTATTTSIEIETDDASGAAANFTENNVMVIA